MSLLVGNGPFRTGILLSIAILLCTGCVFISWRRVSFIFLPGKEFVPTTSPFFLFSSRGDADVGLEGDPVIPAKKVVNEPSKQKIEHNQQQMSRSQKKKEEQPRLAIVNSIFGGYDDAPPTPHKDLVTDPRISFFYYTDSKKDAPRPWVTIRTPYWNSPEDDVGGKNSISNKSMPIAFRYKMMGKYIKCMTWKLPELQNYSYVYWIDGNVVLSAARDLYDVVVGTLEKNNAELLLPEHPSCRDLVCEGNFANQQPRYQEGRILDQMKMYIEDYKFPYNQSRHFWFGTWAYKTSSERIRTVLSNIYKEGQIYSISDQITVPFQIWKAGVTPYVVSIPFQEYCIQTLRTKKCLRNHSKKTLKEYGKIL